MPHAIVTGAAGGIGLAISQRLAREGFTVSLVDLDARNVELAARSIGVGAVPFCADVTDEHAIAQLLSQGPPCDLLVNNAGIVRFGPLLDRPIGDFRLVLETNLIGTFVPSWVVAPHMIERGRGCIVNISSINSVNPGPGAGAYPAAKAGVTRLTQQMAIEWGPLGLRVNCVAPGFIDGGMSKPVFSNEAVRARRSAGVPLRRLGAADEVAAAVMFLASDEASYISGHELLVDGGVTHSLLAHLSRD